LVWERNRGNGEPWVCGRRPKQMGRGVGLKMSVARGCWFAQRVGGWRKEGTTFVGCWMEKRKACAVHGSENQKQEGWLCFFLFKWRERPEEEDETGLRFFVFGSSFLKNYPLLNIFLPLVHMAGGSII